MRVRVVFSFHRALVAACVTSAGVAVGLGCSAAGSLAPAVPELDAAGGGLTGINGSDAGASSGGGEAFATEGGAVVDASDSGRTCTGEGGPGTFTCTGSLSVPRDVPSGAGLPDGTVLVAGGRCV